MNNNEFYDKAVAYAFKNILTQNAFAQTGSVIASLHANYPHQEIEKRKDEIYNAVNYANEIAGNQKKILDKELKKIKKIYTLEYEDKISKRKVREGLPELPGAKKGKVIMRFRPSPSGPLHVGHIISNMISSLFVKKYGGKFYVIIDDTNPETTRKEAYKNIKRDCDWIFGNVTEYIDSSNRMKIYYDYVEKLIKKNSAYVCSCSGDEFREFVKKKKNCDCRSLSVKENLERWKKMLKDSKSGEFVLRFKSSMKNPNPAMRDFPLARVNLNAHPLQKKKYRVWPLMNLVVAVDDMELGMTHVIRGKDHRDNAKRQEMIFGVFGKKAPWTFFIGRIKFTDLILGKRRLSAAIEAGEFSGEEDERLPTIASLRKRKYKPEAFEKFVIQRGLTQVDKVMKSKDFFEVVERFGKEQ